MLYRKLFMVMLVTQSIVGFSQSFMLAPSLDTIFFDSKRYPQIKAGAYLYEYGIKSNYENEMYTQYLRKLQITKIYPINYGPKSSLEEYLNYYFDSYINYKTHNEWPLYYSKKVAEDGNDNSVLKSSFAIVFDKEPVGLELNKGEQVITNDTIKVDLNKMQLTNNKSEQKINSYGLFTCLFNDGSKQTIYNINCYIKEGVNSMYYIVTEKNVIKQVYHYYK